MSNRPRIFICRELPIDPAAVLGEGFAIEVFPEPRAMREAELREAAARSDGLVTLLSDRVDAGLLEACPGLRVVSNYAVGYDNIDVEAATRLGVQVTNTPGVLTEATADLTWALLLGLARRIPEGDAMMKSRGFSGWAPSLLLGMELASATLGLFGFGRLGQAVARRARGFGMKVLVTSRSPIAEHLLAAHGAEQVPLDALLEGSDVISIHCPLNEASHHVFDSAAFAKMRNHALIVNTARGPVIDEAALVTALDAGEIGGAALDVFEREPEIHPGLKSRDDVVMMPHVGSATVTTRRRMAEMVLRDAAAVLRGESPAHPVNRLERP